MKAFKIDSRIISLDFDGVLHPSPRHLPRRDLPVFVWLPLLERLLDPHQDVGLLVHSSWRESFRVDEIEDMLHPMEHRFVGVTPQGGRESGIRAWRERYSPSGKCLAIDDDEELQTQSDFEVIHCDPRRGLSDLGVQLAIERWLASSSA